MKREIWLDYSRSFACILVALGHLLMSFEESSILRESGTAAFIVDFIYHFHVYIFFFCSGYLFQKKFSGYAAFKEQTKNRLIRCLDYLIVYVVFSFITYLIKILFSNDVNMPVEETFFQILLHNPINQMWYMYAILFITLLTPVIRNDISYYLTLGTVVIAKILICIPSVSTHIHHPFDYLMNNEVWFILGAVWGYKKIVLSRKLTYGFILFFIIVSSAVYISNADSEFINVILTFTGMIGIIELIRIITSQKQSMCVPGRVFSKYTLQIYLLHTIFAAGIRIILLKVGTDSFVIHLIMGLIFSFLVPIFCAYIAEKTKILNLFFFPSKTIILLRKK